MSCMYVWMSILPTQATEMAHPDIHTRTHAVSENDDFSMYVCRPMENCYSRKTPLKLMK